MQIVMRYYVTDGFTYGYDCIEPIRHESLEFAIADFDACLKRAIADKQLEFVFAGKRFNTDSFIEHGENNEPIIKLPEFLTIDDWFKHVP